VLKVTSAVSAELNSNLTPLDLAHETKIGRHEDQDDIEASGYVGDHTPGAEEFDAVERQDLSERRWSLYRLRLHARKNWRFRQPEAQVQAEQCRQDPLCVPKTLNPTIAVMKSARNAF
jgi:hypothetical protein